MQDLNRIVRTNEFLNKGVRSENRELNDLLEKLNQLK